MIQFPIARTTLLSLALASLLGLGACSAPSRMPESTALSARLSGASEVPPAAANGSGSVDAHLNRNTNVFRWTITYEGLTGPATAGHFHGPAAVGQNAGVALPLSGSLASPIRGSITLTAAQASDLMAGRWYLNLHTAAHPGGEIRGQVTGRN